MGTGPWEGSARGLPAHLARPCPSVRDGRPGAESSVGAPSSDPGREHLPRLLRSVSSSLSFTLLLPSKQAGAEDHPPHLSLRTAPRDYPLPRTLLQGQHHRLNF